jgi:S-DNA-T family DNA segregation ATPase FtsK/SpoIIIE
MAQRQTDHQSYEDALRELGRALTELKVRRGDPSYARILSRGDMLRLGGDAPATGTMSEVLAGTRYISVDKLMWLVRALMSWDEYGLECDPPGHRDQVLAPWRQRWVALAALRTEDRRRRTSKEDGSPASPQQPGPASTVPSRETEDPAACRSWPADVFGPGMSGALGDRQVPESWAALGDRTAVLKLLELFGVSDVTTWNPEEAWRAWTPQRHLRVSVGIAADGSPMEIDLKPSWEGGMGPHGLCIGTTGTGRSRVLQMIALGLALSHDPQDLSLLFVDGYGSTAFEAFDGLPHTAGVVGEDAERLAQVLTGEMRVRQGILRTAQGDFASASDYQQAQRRGADLPPLPSLVIIADCIDWSSPALLESFVQVARVGRTLGMHLLIGSHQLDKAIQRLQPLLTCRLVLRTFSAEESRALVGTADAHQLPRGRALLGLAAGPSVGFTALGSTIIDERITDWAVGRMGGCGGQARRIWLPPLDSPPSVGELCAAHRSTKAGQARLLTPIGLVDDPLRHRQEPMLLDGAGRDGPHTLIVGRLGTGTSTLLSSVLAGSCLLYGPSELKAFCIDMGTGQLLQFRGLPQVAAAYGRERPDLVRQTLQAFEAQLSATDAPPSPASVSPVHLLVISHWQVFQQDHPDLVAQVIDLARRSAKLPNFHLLVGSHRHAAVPPVLRELLGNRFELGLDDPAESTVDPSASQRLPLKAGQGLTSDGLRFLAALPCLDPGGSLEELLLEVVRRQGPAPD